MTKPIHPNLLIIIIDYSTTRTFFAKYHSQVANYINVNPDTLRKALKKNGKYLKHPFFVSLAEEL